MKDNYKRVIKSTLYINIELNFSDINLTKEAAEIKACFDLKY